MNAGPEGGVYPINATKTAILTQVEGHRPADLVRTTGSPTPVPSKVQMTTRKPEGGVRSINTTQPGANDYMTEPKGKACSIDTGTNLEQRLKIISFAIPAGAALTINNTQ